MNVLGGIFLLLAQDVRSPLTRIGFDDRVGNTWIGQVFVGTILASCRPVDEFLHDRFDLASCCTTYSAQSDKCIRRSLCRVSLDRIDLVDPLADAVVRNVSDATDTAHDCAANEAGHTLVESLLVVIVGEVLATKVVLRCLSAKALCSLRSEFFRSSNSDLLADASGCTFDARSDSLLDTLPDQLTAHHCRHESLEDRVTQTLHTTDADDFLWSARSGDVRVVHRIGHRFVRLGVVASQLSACETTNSCTYRASNESPCC